MIAKVIRYVGWAWMIIVGGLMITPGGVFCLVCGPVLNNVLAVLSIVLGIAGFAFGQRSSDVMPARGALNR